MTWNLDIENVAGIRSGEATIAPGVNAIQASNWQGKTSFMTAMRAILGGEIDAAAVTSGESSGRVTLTETDEAGADARSFTVEILRRASGIRDGTPYLDDEEDRVCADLFAFLDGRNEIRAAVREGADLTPLLTRPFDRMDVDERIGELKHERREVAAELDRAERAAGQLPGKQSRLAEARSELAELQDRLDELEGADDGAGTDGEQSSARAELNDARVARERAEASVTRLERQVETIREELSEKREELDRIDVPTAPDLEDDRERAHDRLSTVEAEVDVLEDLYNVNARILEEGHLDLVTTVDRRIDDDRLACWVCGGETTSDDVEAGLDRLSERISERRETAAELREEVERLDERRAEHRQLRQRRDRLESDVASLETRLDERRSELETSERRLAERTAAVEELEDRVAETDDRRRSIEQEVARTEAEIDRLEEEIEELETTATRRDHLAEREAELGEEIERLRTRRERTIERTQAAFEDALADVLAVFGPSFEAARLDRRTDPDTGRTERIDLVLARDGREITVEELSEGETELVGFIVALAGYEAFDVADRVPCILVDEIGGLAGDNLRALVAYLSDRAEYVVTSAYPETGEFDGRTITPETWDVVSDHTEPAP